MLVATRYFKAGFAVEASIVFSGKLGIGAVVLRVCDQLVDGVKLPVCFDERELELVLSVVSVVFAIVSKVSDRLLLGSPSLFLWLMAAKTNSDIYFCAN